ncbi:MAG: hypothetical protein L3J21_09920 [Devosiaceae bacterium]|nr:hypothetical protein [Devosiaceae bacterium]
MMTWVATSIAGSSIVSGLLGVQAGRQQSRVGRSQVNESRRQFNLTRQDTAAQRELGVAATGRMQGLLSGREVTPGMMGPGYQWRVKQGENSVMNMLGRTGMKRSGRAMKKMLRFGQGQASQEYGNYFARLMQMAGLGAGGAGQSAAMGTRVANSPGFQTQAAAAGTGTAAINNAIQGGLSNYFAYQQNQNLMNRLGDQ